LPSKTCIETCWNSPKINSSNDFDMPMKQKQHSLKHG
jgi:hypothetical protein